MFVPNNVCVYLKAFSGCLAGLGAAGKYLLDPAAGDYTYYARMADAFAQQFDTAWLASVGAAPTGFQEDAIEENCEAVWETHSPLESSRAFIPGNYSGLVNGVIALVIAGNNQVVSEGVDPNGCTTGGAGGGLVFGTWALTKVHADSPVQLPGAAISCVPYDTTNGTIQFRTPIGPQNGWIIVLKPAVPTGTPATLHPQNGGSETVENPSNSGSFVGDAQCPGQGPAMAWMYRTVDNKWIGLWGV